MTRPLLRLVPPRRRPLPGDAGVEAEEAVIAAAALAAGAIPWAGALLAGAWSAVELALAGLLLLAGAAELVRLARARRRT